MWCHFYHFLFTEEIPKVTVSRGKVMDSIFPWEMIRFKELQTFQRAVVDGRHLSQGPPWLLWVSYFFDARGTHCLPFSYFGSMVPVYLPSSSSNACPAMVPRALFPWIPTTSPYKKAMHPTVQVR